MSTRIFFCGEVVADMWERTQGSGQFELFLGGSQFNGAMGAARAIKRDKLDIKAGFVGPLSGDMFGERFMKALEESELDTSCIKRVDRNTTLAIVSVRPGHENAFSFYGRDTAEQMTKIEDLPTELTGGSDKKICWFGSISTVMEPARFAWLEFARKQRDKALVFYDLNTRPSIAKDKVKYREIVLEWASVAHVVKASDADLAWTYPDMSFEEIAKLWLSKGAVMAVFTKGTHGSEVYTNKVKATAETLDLVASNTVGAGDNFNAGLALACAKNDIFSPEAVANLSLEKLTTILSAANNTAAYHLISIGALPREKKASGTGK